MCIFSSWKCTKTVLAGALPRTPLSELTTLPQTTSRLGRGTPSPHSRPFDAFSVSISPLSAPWFLPTQWKNRSRAVGYLCHSIIGLQRPRLYLCEFLLSKFSVDFDEPSFGNQKLSSFGVKLDDAFPYFAAIFRPNAFLTNLITGRYEKSEHHSDRL